MASRCTPTSAPTPVDLGLKFTKIRKDTGMSGLQAAACNQILEAVQGCCASAETQSVDLLLCRKYDKPYLQKLFIIQG